MTNFTRQSPLSFPAVVTSILHLFKESVEFNLHKLFVDLEGNTITGSAFSQARYKINAFFFKDLTDLVRMGYDSSNKLLWKGHLLIAGDGSTLNLPPSKEIEEDFQAYSTTNDGTSTYLARTFFLYDVLNDFVLHGEMSNMKVGEKTLLVNALKLDFPKESIFLLDRGFGHFTTIKELSVRKKDFCVRLPNMSNFTENCLERSEDDFLVTWNPSPKELKNCKINDLEATPMPMRIVKVLLNNGEIELLATSLIDQKKYTKKDIEKLYHYRWGAEEGFKNYKSKMKVEQFGARKTQGVLQEFYAHIFNMNLVGLFGQQADKCIKEKTKHRKLIYQYNWQTAFRILREKITDWLVGKEVELLIERMINAMSQSMTAVKPNRSFARDSRNMKKKLRVTQFYK
ncbi:MAG: hypothetical protein ACI8TA_003468 [Cyclobacteriaceae bacterium]